MRILLVEDSAADAELLALALKAAGAEVARAHSDLGAYQLLETGTAYDALVADLNLGFGTTGFEVAREARRRHPDILVAYVSGEPGATAGEAAPGAIVLRKSPRPADTANAVLEALKTVRHQP